MSVVIGTLTIDLQANTASFSQGMDKMSQLSAKTANDIKRSLEKIGTAGLAMAAAIATGTVAMIKSSLDSADALVKAAQAAGTTTERFSELNYAAKLNGTSTETLTKGLEKLAQSAFKAENGNAQLQRIYARLGVSFQDSNGHLKDSGLLMQQVSMKFAGMKDGAGKTALAMALFGKAGAQLIPMLDSYGKSQVAVNEEAHRFGLVLSTSTGEVAVKAHDDLERLKSMFEGMGFSLLSTTLPALEDLMQKLLSVAQASNLQDLAKSFGGGVTTAVKDLGLALDFAVKNAHALKIALEALAAIQLGKIAIPIIADLVGGGAEKAGAGVAKLALSMTGLTRAASAIPKIGEAIAGVGSSYYGAAKGASFLQVASLGVEQGFGGVGRAVAAIKGLNAASMFTSLGGALRAIPGLLSGIVSGALNASKALILASLSNPWTIAAMAVIALVAVLYKFRNSLITIHGSTYELRDTWNAAWIVMGKAMSWVGSEFMRLVNVMKQAWSSFMAWFAGNAIVAMFKKWFGEAFNWAAGILGKLAPKWAFDALDQAKAEREAKERPAAVAPSTSSNANAGSDGDTSGLAKQKEDLIAKARADMAERLAESAQTLAASGMEEEAQRKVTAANKASNEIMKLGQEIAKQRGITTKDYPSLVDAVTQAMYRSTEATLSDQEATGKLNDIIGVGSRETALSISQAGLMIAAMNKGSDAVARQSALTQAWNELRTKGGNLVQILMRSEQLYGEALAKENVSIAANVVTLKQQLAEKQIVTAATLGLVDAQRGADLQAKLYVLDEQIAKASGETKTQLMGQRQAIIDLTAAEHAQVDAQSALALLSPVEQYKREEDALQHAVAALAQLNGGTLTYGETLQIAAKQQDLFNKMIDGTVNDLLRMNSASAGVDAFFLDMEKQAETTAKIIYDTMNSAFTKLSHSLTELVTGGKAKFGEMFKSLGKEMIDSTLKSSMQRGLGAVAKSGVLGPTLSGVLGKAAGGKMDGSSEAKALWVQMAKAASAPAGGGLGGILGGALGGAAPPDGSSARPFYTKSADGQGGGSLGSFGLGGDGSGEAGGGGGSGDSGGGGGLLSTLMGALIPHASGGSVSPDSAYLVGEQGPEIMSGASGSITSNAASQRMLSNTTGGTVNYSIDARGTDPHLTEQRTRQAIIAAHSSAITNSVRATAEHVKRVPATR